jgi:hypothetical protein
MTLSTTIRKVYQGVTDRRQMYRLFDRHAQRPNRFEGDNARLYAGEFFEIARAEHDYMFELLPPLWMRYGMFALREFLTGSVTSVFFTLSIDDRLRYFHGYCDLSDKSFPERMRAAIVYRETRPVPAMTRAERLEHVWSSTQDEYRGYADWRYPRCDRGKRVVMVFGPDRSRDFALLEQLTDEQVAAKLPVHLRHLPHNIAA